jgi:hypothetical protein
LDLRLDCQWENHTDRGWFLLGELLGAAELLGNLLPVEAALGLELGVPLGAALRVVAGGALLGIILTD